MKAHPKHCGAECVAGNPRILGHKGEDGGICPPRRHWACPQLRWRPAARWALRRSHPPRARTSPRCAVDTELHVMFLPRVMHAPHGTAATCRARCAWQLPTREIEAQPQASCAHGGAEVGLKLRGMLAHLSGRERSRSASCWSPTVGGSSSLRSTSRALGRSAGLAAVRILIRRATCAHVMHASESSHLSPGGGMHAMVTSLTCAGLAPRAHSCGAIHMVYHPVDQQCVVGCRHTLAPSHSLHACVAASSACMIHATRLDGRQPPCMVAGRADLRVRGLPGGRQAALLLQRAQRRGALHAGRERVPQLEGDHAQAEQVHALVVARPAVRDLCAQRAQHGVRELVLTIPGTSGAACMC